MTVDSVISDMPESMNLELHCHNFENLDFAKFFTNFRFPKWFQISLQNILTNIEFCRTEVWMSQYNNKHIKVSQEEILHARSLQKNQRENKASIQYHQGAPQPASCKNCPAT